MVSLAINGNLGDRIGIKIDNFERKVIAHSQGYVALYYEGDLIDTLKFTSRPHRRMIMERWVNRYKLNDKPNIYFQIKYL